MIQNIILKGLFNKFDYNIPLNYTTGDSITFITGCNGMGKTTILNMIKAVMTANFDCLFTVPFTLFEIKGVNYDLSLTPELQNGADYNDDIDKAVNYRPEYSKIKIAFTFEGKNTETVIVRGQESDSLKQIVMFLTIDGCYHIEDSRINIVRNEDNISRISSDCKWLKDELYRAKDVITNALMPLQNIDDTSNDDNISDEKLFELYWQLVDYEIFPSTEKEIFEKDSADYKDVVQSMRRIYPAICKDKNLNKLFFNISEFKRIIKTYSFIDKELEISTRFGFRFKTISDKRILDLNKLSSGERHITIQIFELLFRASIGSLILIDEPEISLHPSWQMDYLSNLESIADARNFQCIVATHQPMMFKNNFDITVDLYRLANIGDYD